MTLYSKVTAFALLFLILVLSGRWDSLYAETQRKYYEAPKDYREQIDRLKEKFKADYGYELLDLDQGWKQEEIVKLDKAFSQLPPTFYRIPGLNGLYRTGQLERRSEEVDPEEVPAGAFPTFTTIYRQIGKSYNVYVGDEDPRIEFYNNLMYEDIGDFDNIVQHEMGHAFDLSQGFLSFSPEWLSISHFRALHLPALDGKENSDFLFTLLNDPSVDVYAPVASRHIPTYSRQNPQEDFANSVAAYMHYPYFRYSHPERYRFLKDKAFGGKEYFPDAGGPGNYEDRVLADLDRALRKKDWDGAVEISSEASRVYAPRLHAAMIARIRQAIEAGTDGKGSLTLGIASCYNYDPDSLELRQELIRQKKAALEDFLKNIQCFRVSRELFENVQTLWPAQAIYFFRENGKNYLQFLDPALLVANARGFQSIYVWRLFIADSSKEPVAEGRMTLAAGNGSVKIDMDATANKPLSMPEGETLILELEIQRHDMRTFKTFAGPPAPIRFVVQPWFNYVGDNPPKVRAVYPLRAAYQGK